MRNLTLDTMLRVPGPAIYVFLIVVERGGPRLRIFLDPVAGGDRFGPSRVCGDIFAAPAVEEARGVHPSRGISR